MMKRCKDYVGSACVDGTCPRANTEEYAERCMDVILSCDDCFYYEGCEDCILSDTGYCNGLPRNDMQRGKGM